MQRAALAGRTARTMSFDLAGCLAGAYYIVVMKVAAAPAWTISRCGQSSRWRPLTPWPYCACGRERESRSLAMHARLGGVCRWAMPACIRA